MRTKIRGCKELVRTILLLNELDKGQDRTGSILHIYTNDEVTSVYDLLVEYRSRQIKTTADEIVVKFDYFRERNALKKYCDKINQSNREISWFKGKVLRFEFESEEEFKKRKSFLSAG